jgi:hypothetical protein
MRRIKKNTNNNDNSFSSDKKWGATLKSTSIGILKAKVDTKSTFGNFREGSLF